MPSSEDRNLVLPPGTYAYVLDETNGHVTVNVGPKQINMPPTSCTVLWDTHLMAEMSKNLNLTAALGGTSLIDTIKKIVSGSSITGTLDAMAKSQSRELAGVLTDDSDS